MVDAINGTPVSKNQMYLQQICNIYKYLFITCKFTCKQSRAVTTILDALLWQANSNGKKYFSAVTILLESSFGRGSADEEGILPSLSPSLISFRISSVKKKRCKYIL